MRRAEEEEAAAAVEQRCCSLKKKETKKEERRRRRRDQRVISYFFPICVAAADTPHHSLIAPLALPPFKTCPPFRSYKNICRFPFGTSNAVYQTSSRPQL